MSNVNDMFSPEEVELMKKSGSVQSKSVSNGPNGVKTKSLNVVKCDQGVSGGWGDGETPKVSPAPLRKVTRPNIEGSGNYVTNTNLSRYNQQDVERKKAFREAELQREEAIKAQAPDTLQNRIEYLERSLKKLQREMKASNREAK